MNIDAESGATHRFRYGAEYDSWGRIRTMTYPDGESVTYSYYMETGELRSVKGQNSQGGVETYLEKVGYDTHSRTAYRKMGNGTEHRYTYDKNERLQSAHLVDGTENTLSSNTYGYDAVGNITRIKGVSESSYYQNYQYDDLSRLTNASGISMEHDSDGGDVFSSYSMGMEYNIMSSPLLYDLTITTTSGTKSTENAYLYGENQPGAPVKVGGTNYKYDASGNPVSMRGGDSDRTLKYDAENRLRVIEDTQNGTMSLYTYNHTGERSLKRYGAFNTAYLNGAYAGSGLDGLTRYSAYVSPYYVEHGTGTNASNATKHYYIGTERLVSKLVTESGGKEDVKDEDTYYYFTDHLGSTTHITDKGGNVVQYAAYTPYGTLFREYKSVMPYKFNGKELDQETGYYYYGARYYDPSAALWIRIDPLQHKYPEVSPYVYCNGNPVKYVDPDGRESKESLSITASAKITIGPQIGLNVTDMAKAKVNVAAVTIAKSSASLNIDEYGCKPNFESNIVGLDCVTIQQEASIGAGVPILGGAELSAKNTFTDKNGHVTPDNNQTGVEFDIEALKVSFEIDCIIGVKAEINVNAIKGKNTFKYIFETALELITNKINRQDD